MTQVIDKARKRLAEIELEKNRLEQFIATYNELSTGDTVKIGDFTEAEIRPAVEHHGRKSDKPNRIIQVAKEAIREAGHPLTRSQLVDTLENKGLSIGGADKNKNMGTILWRSKQFNNVDGSGYWPTEDGEWHDL